ncbi:MAG: hypothetical protein FWD78_02425 [Treponema sp.]|nr:hypothetical protein [Treponema sp.]
MENPDREIIKQLESAGFCAAFLPYHVMEQIKNHYNELEQKNSGAQNVKNAVKHFLSNQPPDIPFEPKSLLITAYPADPAQIIFKTEGKSTAVVIPPTYLSDEAGRKKFDSIMETAAAGFKTAHPKGISQKLLAVLGGLGRYGRNNIFYSGKFGSYCGLSAFYTDIPCDDVSFPLRFLDECESCSLCLNNCPTGAIGKNAAINSAKCLTMYNENKNPMPDWIPANAHHTLVGCLRCQETCPANKPLSQNNMYTLQLDEAQTKDLLACETPTPELAEKLKQFGLHDYFIAVICRNAGLALRGQQFL